METRQLYAAGKPFQPETGAENIRALDIYGLTGHQENALQAILDKIADMVANKLMGKDEIAGWAKQETKPQYTAGEVGADASGSAGMALEEAKAYADIIQQRVVEYTDGAIAELINGAPESLDTLKEIADAMAENATVVEALHAAIGSRASAEELQRHTSNGGIHITEGERNWIGEAQEKLEGMEAGANRVTLTKSLLATVEGTALDAIAAPAIVGMINSLKADLTNSIEGLTQSFQDGCNAIFNACKGQGITPATNSPSNISTAIANIASNKYNAGVAAADARANPASANWQNGRAQGRSDVTSSPNSYGLYTKAQYNANHTAGYNAGVTAADARANPASANWQNGRAQGQADITSNPNAYGLYTQAQYNAHYAAGAASSLSSGLASARLIKSYSKQLITESIDIKQVYANYAALTANNFIVRVTRVDSANYSGSTTESYGTLTHSYSAAEGVLTLNINYAYRMHFWTCDVFLLAP